MMENQSRGPTWSGWELRTAVGILVAIILVMTVWEHIYRSGTATRTDVAVAMRDLEPACRPIVTMRIRSRLMREGRPMTRGDLASDTQGLHHCDEINEQMTGLADS